MKGKGSKLAILLATVLTLIGSFGVTAFAAPDTTANAEDVTMTLGYWQHEVNPPADPGDVVGTPTVSKTDSKVTITYGDKCVSQLRYVPQGRRPQEAAWVGVKMSAPTDIEESALNSAQVKYTYKYAEYDRETNYSGDDFFDDPDTYNVGYMWIHVNKADVKDALQKTGDDHGIIKAVFEVTLAGGTSPAITYEVNIDVNNLLLLDEDDGNKLLKTADGKLVSTITFYANHGTGETATQDVPIGEDTKLDANTFNYPGYVFKHWSASASSTEKAYDDKDTVNIKKDTALYAVWEEHVHNWKIGVPEGVTNQANVKCKANGCPYNYPSETKFVAKIEAESQPATGTAVPATITTNPKFPEEITVSESPSYLKWDGENWIPIKGTPAEAGKYKAVAEVRVADSTEEPTTIYVVYELTHEHSYKIVHNGSSPEDKSRVNVSCETPGCDVLPKSKNVKIKITGGASRSYTGDPVVATIAKTEGTPNEVVVGDVNYVKQVEGTEDWGEASTTPPSAVGHYKASAEVSIGEAKETIEVEFTINPCEHVWDVEYSDDHSEATVTCEKCKVSAEISLTSESPVIYTGKSQQPATLTENLPEGIGLTTTNSGGYSVLYYTGTSASGGKTGVTLPGDYCARTRLYPAGEDGKAIPKSTAIASIVVPIKVIPSVTVEAKGGLVYDDNQELVTTTWNPAEHEGYTIKYEVDSLMGQESEEIPRNVALDVNKTHVVYYNVYDSDNHVVEELSGSVEVSIAQATVEVTRPTAINPTYDGTEQVLVEPGSLNNDKLELGYAVSESQPEDEDDYGAVSTATARNADDYTVWYQVFVKETGEVASTTNYKFVDAESKEPIVLPALVEAKIKQLGVVIRAVDNSKDEGDDDPKFDYTVKTTGEEPRDVTEIFKADVPSYHVYRYYDVGENPGTYRIDDYDYDRDDKLISNYSRSFDDEGKLTIKATDAYPVGLTQTYNTEEQPLVAVGEQGDGTSFVYVVNPAEGSNPDDWEYTTEIPKATDAGVYDVYYAVAKNGKKIGQWKQPANQPEIRKAPIKIKARGYNGVYDAEPHPAVVTVDGIYEADKAKEDQIAIYYSQTEPIDEHNWKGKTKTPVSIKNVGEKTVYYFARFKNDNTLSDNYEIVGEAGGSVALKVTAKDLWVLVADETITYGDAYEPTDDDYAVVGLIEDPHHIHVTLTAQDDDETPYEPGMDVGEYDIVATVTGSSDVIKNYDVHTWEGTLTVVKKNLKITADDKEIPYNTSVKGLTVSYDGLIDKDVKDPTAAKKEPKDGVIKGMQRVSAPDYSKGEDVGEYDIIPSDFTSKNYEIELAKGTLTVIPRGVVIGWNYDPDEPFEYDGEEYTVTPYLKDRVSGAVDVENAEGENITNSATDAGTYTAKAKLTGDDAGNYTIPDGQGTINWTIVARPAWVEWTKTSFTYDGKEHTVGYELRNVVNGDSFKADIIHDKGTEADTYIAEISGFTPANNGTKASNYKFYTDETKRQEIGGAITANTRWTISRAEATIKANDNTIYYGYAPSDAGYTPSGVAKGDNIGTVTYAFSYTQNGKPGSYEIKPVVTGANPNYVVRVESGKLTVLDNVTTLVAQGKASGKKAVNVSWNGVTNAASYDVYLAKCNSKSKKNAPSLKGSTSGNSLKVSGLKKGTCYKYYVVAKNASGNVIAQSTTGHFIAGNVSGKKTNARSITASSGTVTLNKGGSYTLSTSQSKAKKGKKYKLLSGGHAALTRYISSNPSVATVGSNGVITGVGGGYCKVYALAVNGMWAEVEVYVN